MNAIRPILLAAGVVALALAAPRLRAHCDTLDGPTVTDARVALEKGDVTSALKWVRAADEAEIRAAFARTLKVRPGSAEARELADLWFFETLVRVHRAGEGAPYTGLKPAGTDPGPVVRAADEALEKGSIDALAKAVAAHAEAGVRERFERAARAREHKEHSVDLGREYVEAYVDYVHFVENVHNLLAGAGAHHAEAAPAAPAHAHEH